MYRYIKPIFDVVCAICLLILCAPIMLAVAIFIFMFMGRPILFAQKRPGFKENIFTIYKFRTMRDIGHKANKSQSDEDRLSFVGKIIRSLSLDELPQLFNIIKGDMSFIGPRPLLIEYLKLYDKTQKRRHDVKPGITGLAQVNGRNNINWQRKFELDVYYVEHLSFMMDIKIALLTIKKVLIRDGISKDNHATSDKFTGNKD